MQVGIGGNYYANVHGYIHGVYNLTGQQFVLGGVNLDFVRNDISIGVSRQIPAVTTISISRWDRTARGVTIRP